MHPKALLRSLFYRSFVARQIIGWLSVGLGRTASLGVSHLATYNDRRAIGPLQQSEALLLFSIVKTVLPMTLVEFGFYQGHSAFNFLQAMPPGARLFSYDVSADSLEIARKDFSRYPNFKFLHKSQTDFRHADIDHRPIDLVFFDASHDLSLNQQTFQSIYPALSEDSIICIHDTGLWNKGCFEPMHHQFVEQQGHQYWLDDVSYAHQNSERKFVNWILDTHPAFQSVHFHSSKSLRHGLTVLQGRRTLATV